MQKQEYTKFNINSSRMWHQGKAESLYILEKGGISLSPIAAVTGSQMLPRLAGFCFERNGTIVFIDGDSGFLWCFNLASSTLKRIPCFGGIGMNVSEVRTFSPKHKTGTYLDSFHWPLNTPISALAMSQSMVGICDVFNYRVQVFMKQTLQARYVVGALDLPDELIANPDPREKAFIPWDCTFDECGSLLILDAVSRRVLKFSKNGKFSGCLGDKSFTSPISMTKDFNNDIHILDASDFSIYRFARCGTWNEVIDLSGMLGPSVRPSGLAIDAKGNYYIGEQSDSGLASLVFHTFNNEGKYVGTHKNPFGSCKRIHADEAGHILADCVGNGLISMHNTGNYAEKGTYYSKAFDSTESETLWHSIQMDASLEESTRIQVFYYCSNYKPENISAINESHWSSALSIPFEGVHANDNLLRGAKGRYCALKLVLTGDGEHTPTIRLITIMFPLQSYLRYLPAVYQNDKVSRDFLERFLSLFESFNIDVEETITLFSTLFNPASTPSSFLPWLSTWLGIAYDYAWPEEKVRQLVESAYELFKLRGTISGLKKLLGLYTDAKISIIEHFQFFRPLVLGIPVQVGLHTVVGKRFSKRLIIEESSRLGEFVLNEQEDPPETPFEADAYDFTVFLGDNVFINEEQERVIRRIIEENKPAHTRYVLKTGNHAFFTLGKNSYIQIDTRLSCGHPMMRVGKNSYISQGTFVGTRNIIRGVFGIHSRLEFDDTLH